MRLSVNVISRGKYIRAFEEIDPSDVPAFARKFAVTDSNGARTSRAVDDGEPLAPEQSYADELTSQREHADEQHAAVPAKLKKFVRRGNRWLRAKTAELVPGEPLYAVKPGTFPAVFVRVGKVKKGAG